VAYGTPGAAPQGTQAVGGLGKALGILLIIYLPLQALGIISTVSVAGKARDYLDGTITETQFRDATTVNLGSLAGLLVIPIAVLTMIWMFRMASNLRALGRSDATWSPGWAIGGWFCPPCVVYAIPWLMFRELWKGSDPDVAPGDPTWKTRPVPVVVNLWWVLYGLVPLLGIVSAAGMFAQVGNTGDMTRLAERIDDFVVLNTVLSVIGLGTTVVYLLLVRGLTERHCRAIHER
jgi:hypothetical protein